MSSTSLSLGPTPLVPIKKILKPHKISPLHCTIHAKCEFRNPSGSIWDRLVFHEFSKTNDENVKSYVTGGINELCLSLAWAAVGTAGLDDEVAVSVFPGPKIDDTKLQLLHGFGAKVILSYQQDPNRENSWNCVENHIQKLESTCRAIHHKFLPNSSLTGDENNPYQELIEEVVTDKPWDTIVCSGQDIRLLRTLRTKFSEPDTNIITIDLSENSFTDAVGDIGATQDFNWSHVSDAESYDMARRLVREEGLLVGPISGAIMAAAMKEAALSSPISPKNILVILPDSLQNSTKDFLSADWMLQKGYYQAAHQESLFWWYEMALENISPPEALVVTPETSVKTAYAAMCASSTERCVVITSVSGEEKRVIGVTSRECLAVTSLQDPNIPVGNVCTRQFGLIDSKSKFSELERLLRRYNWVVNMHHVPVYNTTEKIDAVEPQLTLNTREDVVGVINMADFIGYKNKIEKHHLSEYGLAMSDGIPSGVWLERFNEQLKTSALT